MLSGSSRLRGIAMVALVASVSCVLSAPSPTLSARTAADYGAGDRQVTWSTVVRDPDEDDGADGPLDIARVSHRLDVSGSTTRIGLRLVTYEPFRLDDLHAARRHLVVELDTDGEPGAERNLRISSRKGTAVAELISNATRRVLARLQLIRPDARTVGVSADRDVLGARKYFWTTTYHRAESVECGQAGGFPRWCQDTVPDQGWIQMARPAWPRS